MSETKNLLNSLTALGGDTPITVTVGDVMITERFDIALASVAVRRGSKKELVRNAKAAGLPLPAATKAETAKLYSSFWMTPEMWMVEAPFSTHEDISAILKVELGGFASVTEQTDAWVRFDITAPNLVPMMERLSNIDLAVKPVGFVSRTIVEHLGLYLIKRSDTEITLYGPRASAKSLFHALEVAAFSVQ